VIRRRDFRRLMRALRVRLKATRGLRFRLMASYALFFSVLLIGVAVLFRARLVQTLNNQVQVELNEQWAAMKGYLRIEKKHELDPDEKAFWYYDKEDPDETAIVLNIKLISLVANADGKVIMEGEIDEQNKTETPGPAVSPTYDDIGVDPPAEIAKRVAQLLAAYKPNAGKPFWAERRNSQGERFMIRGGIVWDQAHRLPYYVALGLPLARYNNIQREFTWIYAGVVPVALILGSFLGWIMAGRALTPVVAVAQAAQRISGSNLSLRIPTRQSGDELDYLVHTFNRMIERLESSFQQIKQFSTDVSHELRTPITAIRGQLEVALFTAKTTEQYREAMFNALPDIDRLSQIVRALLLLSQAESGQLVLQKTHLDLCDVARDQVDQFQIPAEAAGVRLTVDLPAACSVEGDRVQIDRMISNLLSNALKFTPEGGEVRMKLESAADHVEIIVEDTGRGIPTEHLPHIFDRFYRVPGTGTAPAPEQGLGLGLSFVAWIVKAHQGKIEVHSTPGAGTRFTIKLPAEGVVTDAMELEGQPAGLP